MNVTVEGIVIVFKLGEFPKRSPPSHSIPSSKITLSTYVEEKTADSSFLIVPGIVNVPMSVPAKAVPSMFSKLAGILNESNLQ